MWDGKLPPEKCLRTTPSRTSENIFSEHSTKFAIIIDLCAQMENWSFNLETKEEQESHAIAPMVS